MLRSVFFLFQAILERELQESHFKEQQLQLTNTIIQGQMEALTGAKEEREKEVVSLYNALEVNIFLAFLIGRPEVKFHTLLSH